MLTLISKEFRQFFSNLSGYLAIIVFLLLSGLFLFVFPATNVLDAGYASLNTFFELAPWLLLLLIPAITMRSVAEERRTGTWELLRTLPISPLQIIVGKWMAAVAIAVTALLPTLLYWFTLNQLAVTDGVDSGATIGSYLGLLLLSATFSAIGIFTSSLHQNAVVAFLLSIVLCFVLFFGFQSLSQMAGLPPGLDYAIEWLGMAYHFNNLGKGVMDSRDVVYFASVAIFFLYLSVQKAAKA